MTYFALVESPQDTRGIVNLKEYEMERLLNSSEVARLLGIAEITVRKWTASGYLPHLKLGRRTLFDPQQMREWRDRRRVNAGKSFEQDSEERK